MFKFCNSGAIFSILLAALLVGCASAPQAPTSLKLDLGAEKSLTFKKVDESGNSISTDTVVKALEDSLYSATGLKKLYEIPKFTEKDGTVSIAFIRGVEITRSPNIFNLAYINGEKFISTLSTYKTESVAHFEYSITEKSNSIIVKILPPKEVVTVVGPAMLSAWEPLLSNAELMNNVQKTFNDLNPSIELKKEITGEINVGYSAEAVTANFRRMPNSNVFVEKGGFRCAVNGTPMSIEVLPYKNGSKVRYAFDVRYTLNSKGESSYSQEATKILIAAIEKIVKD